MVITLWRFRPFLIMKQLVRGGKMGRHWEDIREAVKEYINQYIIVMSSLSSHIYNNYIYFFYFFFTTNSSNRCYILIIFSKVGRHGKQAKILIKTIGYSFWFVFPNWEDKKTVS